jgi:dGTP triphosphohydrolase
MIEFNVTIGGERVSVSLPDASAITVPAVAKAATEAVEAHGLLREARRVFEAAQPAVARAKAEVKRQAADLAIKKKDLPKNIRQSIKDAEEATADALVALEAREAAMRHAYATLVAEVNANRKTLEAEAFKGAEASLERMALARKAFENAAAEAHASYGLLGMFVANAQQGRTLLKFRDPKGSRRGFLVSGALSALGQAVGRSALELEALKRGGDGVDAADDDDD